VQGGGTLLETYVNNEFVRIRKSVSRKLEITELVKRHGKKPILLEDLGGKKAVLNLWADRERIYRELKMTRDQFLLNYESSLSENVNLKEGEKLFKSKADMKDVPVCWHYPGDAGYYITSGIFVAERNGKRNLSIHRVFVESERGGYARLVPRDLLKMYNDAVSHGEEMKVSIVIGSPLEFLLASATSVPFEQDESMVAASLYRKSKGKEMEFSRSKFGLLVPCNSDYVINAILTGKAKEEGTIQRCNRNLRHTEWPTADSVRFSRVRQRPDISRAGPSHHGTLQPYGASTRTNHLQGDQGRRSQCKRC
jgi:3-polyprenyl-4-hydroxybenzoate decarboxylase and related decarboxylases